MQFWAVVRSAAVNIPEYITLGVHVCRVYAWGGNAGWWDLLMFSSGRYCLTVFQNTYTSLHSHQAWMRFPFFPLIRWVLFIWALLMSVICISLMANEGELFLYLLAFLFPLLWRAHRGLRTREKLLRTRCCRGSGSVNPGPMRGASPLLALPFFKQIHWIPCPHSTAGRTVGARAPAWGAWLCLTGGV